MQHPYLLCDDALRQHVEIVANGLPMPMLMRWHYLAALVEHHGWTTGVELGVWRGLTFIYLLMACPKLRLHGVDLWAEAPNDLGFDSDLAGPLAALYKQRLSDFVAPRFAGRADLIEADTVAAAERFADESLDFVFVDADHSSDAVERDIRAWWPKLKSDGWLVGHDISLDSVKSVVDRLLPAYAVGPNNVWGRPKRFEFNRVLTAI